MNGIVAVPNWSFHDPKLAVEARKLLSSLKVRVHYCQGDVDHQRTVTAFSGLQAYVFDAALDLARLLLPTIDLRKQHGVHPRIGALDVMPFVLLEGLESELIEGSRTWAKQFSSEFGIPYHLYEKAALAGKEHRLPYLRGQVKGTAIDVLKPNARWGVSIIGVRDFLLATNVEVASADVRVVRSVARRIREAREAGDTKLAGVRALGFELKSRGITQLSLNLTNPNETSFDQVMDFAEPLIRAAGTSVVGTELIGVIRRQDLPGASRLTVDPSQVVDESVTI